MHRYDDMPQLPRNEPVAPQPDVTAWQEAHEPLLTMRAWMSAQGRVMVNVSWSDEVSRAEVMEKPLLDMMSAILHVAASLSDVSDAVHEAATAQALLGAVKGDN